MPETIPDLKFKRNGTFESRTGLTKTLIIRFLPVRLIYSDFDFIPLPNRLYILLMQIIVGVITISDRASKGLYDDLGGPAVKKAAETHGWKVATESLVPDEKREIQRAIRELIAKGCNLILTTGGTGVAPRDVTPEAVREIASRELPGFGEAMRMESLKITCNAILSRSLAAVVEKSLVVCLPGKPSGAVECLGFVSGAIPHCIEVISEVPTSC
jgi:molybdopterin adenylyltransferase